MYILEKKGKEYKKKCIYCDKSLHEKPNTLFVKIKDKIICQECFHDFVDDLEKISNER